MISQETAKNLPWWKYALAGLGALYIAGTAIWLVSTATRPAGVDSGPSELALHPERQNEILAHRRADNLQQQLGLNDQQAKQVAAIVQEFQQRRQGMLQSGADAGPLQRIQFAMQMRTDLRGRLETVLTPEQLTKFEATMQERISGVIGALRQTGVYPAAGGPPPTPEQRRERITGLLQPAAPAPLTPSE